MLVPFIPLLAILINVWIKDRYKVAKVSVYASGITFLLSLFFLITYAIKPEPRKLSLIPPFEFYFDALSAVMLTAVSGISFVVHKYSVKYLQEEEGYKRFFVLLDLITVALLMLVSADNMLLFLFSWNTVGVLLYLLLNHNYRRKEAVKYNLWTLVIHKLGDIPLFLALGILFTKLGTLSLSESFSRLGEISSETFLLEGVALLVVLSAFMKSAQIPFHLWLPYTMEGPTPVSALMHAGIVNAGGFLINRFAPVFYYADLSFHLAFLVGLLTAVLGSILMLAQSDIKKALGYSTVGQMGYMIMEAGVGAFALAIYHLIAHGIFKATLFMNSGSIIHQARKDTNIPKDEIYSYLAKGSLPPRRLPWLVFAVITVVVPLVIVVFAHLFVSEDFFQFQGAIVLLFFGWITGAQVIFSTYRHAIYSVAKLLLFTVISFSVVILGYVVIGHSFEAFLYPDKEFVRKLYQNAQINELLFDLQVIALALIIAGGWFLAYYASENKEKLSPLYQRYYEKLYKLLYEEVYFPRLYKGLGRLFNYLSERLNALTRWL